jgi:hypothetical protein
MSSTPGPTLYSRGAGGGVNRPTEEVMRNVAFYRDLRPDPNAFVDKADPTKRLPIKYVISTDNKAAPAGISTLPLKGIYRIYYNKDPEEFVELGPYDTFSVPPRLWRRVEQQGEPGTQGMIMVLFDDVDDPNTGIFVPQEVIDADRARGFDPYAKAGA